MPQGLCSISVSESLIPSLHHEAVVTLTLCGSSEAHNVVSFDQVPVGLRTLPDPMVYEFGCGSLYSADEMV
jgi:hypothetical protein